MFVDKIIYKMVHIYKIVLSTKRQTYFFLTIKSFARKIWKSLCEELFFIINLFDIISRYNFEFKDIISRIMHI